MADIVMRRSFSPWFHLEFLFRLSPLGKKQAKYLATLHDMTDSVIKIRKDGYLQKKLNSSTIAERNDIGKARQFKRRHSDWLYSSSDKHTAFRRLSVSTSSGKMGEKILVGCAHYVQLTCISTDGDITIPFFYVLLTVHLSIFMFC
jgi:hypothetical protein